MNIPAPSERTIRENIGKSSFTTGAEIQVLESTITCSFIDDNHFSLLLNYIKVFSKVLSIFCIYHLTQTAILDEAHKVHPNSQWWIKADGCDLVSGLGNQSSKCGVVMLTLQMGRCKRCMMPTLSGSGRSAT